MTQPTGENSAAISEPQVTHLEQRDPPSFGSGFKKIIYSTWSKM